MSDYQGNIIIKNPATPTGPAQDGAAPGMWKLSEVLPFVRQGIWPTQGIQGKDPFFPYVSLLLSTTALSNANNNLFVDSSGAFNPVSRFGNATQGSATPYGASWSNFFDGSGDYFTVPYTTANFDWYTAGVDFTIEYWFFANSLTGTSYVDGGATKSTVVGNRSATATTDYWSFGPNAGGTVTFYYFNGGPVAVNSTSTITANTWNHIAMTKTSSGITIFVNGVAQTTTAISGTPQSSASFPITVGQGNNTSYNGYVSNLRIVRGTAIYSGNFTVPTSPLTAVSNTTLLTCQSNRFRDASTNNLTLTVTGNILVTEFSPFAPASPGISYNQNDIQYWSGYFDGSGDYLYYGANSAFAFGTGNFTVEFFVYTTSATNQMVYDTIQPGISGGGSNRFFVYINTSQQVVVGPGTSQLTTTGTITLGAWNHIAVVRNGSTRTVYINGVSAGSDTFSGDLSSGYASVGFDRASGGSIILNGYLSNLRAVKGTAVYTSAFTPPTASLTAISGTSLLVCQSAAFTDNSTNNFVVTINGNTTVTGNSPFGPTGFWSLSGTSTQGATIPQTTATDLGSGSFTVECWVYLQNYTTSGIVTKRRTDTALTGSWGIFVNTSGFIIFQGVGWASTYTATTGAIPVNTWAHVAVSRSGTNLSVFVNGVRVINATDSFDYTCSTYTIIKLAGNAGGNYPSGGALNSGISGSISNLRIVQGTAVYSPASTTITVPTSPLTAISGTSLLTCQNGTMKDNSTNNNTSIALYSGAALQSFDPFYTSTIASNGGSMYFDGTGDYLVPANGQQLFSFGRNNFTLDCWVYLPAAPSIYFGLVDCRTSPNLSSWLLGIWNTGGALRLDAVYAGGRLTASSTSIPVGAWTHITFSQVSDVARFFVNGVADSSTVSSVSWDSTSTAPTVCTTVDNYPFSGYMNSFRVVRGSGVSANFTPPTAPVTPTPNTTLLLNGMNAGAYDATAINDMETVGNAQVSTVQSKFGGSSIYVPSGGGCALIPNSQPLVLGSGNWTVEFWAYTDASGTKVYLDALNAANTTFQMEIYSSGTNLYWVKLGGSVAITATGALTANTWQHIAVTKSGSSTRLFVNGTQVGSTYTDTDTYDSARWEIGGRVGLTFPIVGYMDDFRITKGVARYTTTFTPPTQAFPTF